MTTPNVSRRSVVADLSGILASREVARLIEDLERTRLTGRPGYSTRGMVAMMLAKSMYALPTWTRTVALVREHPALAAVIAPDGNVPSQWACYRFRAKLRAHTDMLEECIAGVLKELKKRNPLLGWDVAIDASDMPAYANGQRFVSKGGRERARRRSTATPMRPGATAPQSRRARAAASTDTASTWPCAPEPICRWRGRSRRPR